MRLLSGKTRKFFKVFKISLWLGLVLALGVAAQTAEVAEENSTDENSLREAIENVRF